MTFVSLKLCSGVNIGLGFNNPKSCNEKHYSSLVVLLGKESQKKFANSTVPSFLSLKMLLWAWDQNKNKGKVLSCRVQLNVQRASGVNLVHSMLDWKHPLLCKVWKGGCSLRDSIDFRFFISSIRGTPASEPWGPHSLFNNHAPVSGLQQ